jgi:hypothetical protein
MSLSVVSERHAEETRIDRCRAWSTAITPHSTVAKPGLPTALAEFLLGAVTYVRLGPVPWPRLRVRYRTAGSERA